MPSQLSAQEIVGDCNVKLNGSGNDVTINCPDRSAPPADDVRLVVGGNGSPIVLGFVNWSFVDPYLSEFWVSIDDDEVVRSNMDHVFSDVKLKLKPGTHFYSMGVDFEYTTGTSSAAECSGVVKVEAPASIIPRLRLNQAYNGDLSPAGCGFDLR